MKGETIFEMIGYADDALLIRCDRTGMRHKWLRRLAAAAIVMLVSGAAMTAVAHDAGIREALRNLLGIGEKNIRSYVEFEPDAADTDSIETPEAEIGLPLDIRLIAGIRDRENQRWYFTVSPLTREEAETMSWTVVADGQHGNQAFPVKRQDEENLFDPDTRRFLVDDAYDAETGTLLLETVVWAGNIPSDAGTGEPLTAKVYGGPAAFTETKHGISYHRSLITHSAVVQFSPTEADDGTQKTISFGDALSLPVSSATGKSVRFLDITFHAAGFVALRCTVPGVTDESEIFSCVALMDSHLSRIEVHSKDGTTFPCFSGERCEINDGIVTEILFIRGFVLPEEIASVTVLGQTFYME